MKDVWICSTCLGSGKVDSKSCDQCKGHGAIRTISNIYVPATVTPVGQ
jgi:DnaJ-class molecular chaperone